MTKKNKSAIQRRLIPTYIFLIIVSFISVFPLYWMISAATNTSTDVSRGRIIPGSHFMENFHNLTAQQPLWRALGNSTSAKIVIIIALIWRWTGYNMVFYLAGLQNIEYSVYEAAKIDGANGWKTFWKITVPLLKPTIIMTFIMSINGTLQLFDESVNLTKGGPANSTITMSHYVYNTCFINVPNFGYASAMSFLIFIMVAVLAFINLKVGDTRD